MYTVVYLIWVFPLPLDLAHFGPDNTPTELTIKLSACCYMVVIDKKCCVQCAEPFWENEGVMNLICIRSSTIADFQDDSSLELIY